jgi:hypothetical protein
MALAGGELGNHRTIFVLYKYIIIPCLHIGRNFSQEPVLLVRFLQYCAYTGLTVANVIQSLLLWAVMLMSLTSFILSTSS